MRTLLSLLAAALVAGRADAQTVWTVDDDLASGADFSCIGCAAQIAADGDTLLVAEGLYPTTAVPFVPIQGRSLVIQAEPDAQVFVNELAIADLAEGQTVVVRGMTIGRATLVSSFASAPNRGTVVFEDCDFANVPAFAARRGLSAFDSASVVLVRCDLRIDAPGVLAVRHALEAVDSSVHLYDCTLRGADGRDAAPDLEPLAGGSGARVDGGFLFASNTLFLGGDGGLGGEVQGACRDGRPGGDGLRLENGAVARVLGSVFAGGAGGATSPACAPLAGPGPDGATTAVDPGTLLDLLPGAPRSFRAAAVVREGEPRTEAFEGAPGELVVQFHATAPLPVAVFLEPLGTTSLIGTGLVSTVAGVLPATGVLSTAVPLGELGPGVETVTLYQQPAFADPSTLGVVLGPPSVVSLLDDAF